MDKDVFSKTSIFDKYAIAFLMNGSEVEKKQFIERIFNIQSRDEYLDQIKKIEKKYISDIDTRSGSNDMLLQNKTKLVEKIESLINNKESFEEDNKNKVIALQKEIGKLEDEMVKIAHIDVDRVLEKIKRIRFWKGPLTESMFLETTKGI